MRHEYISPPPAYLSSRRHPTHFPIRRVFHFSQSFWIHPRRCLVVARRCLLSQRFMRPLLVVFLSELVEALLLRPPVASRRLGRLLFQRPVHSLVPPVLLRLSRR